MEKAFSGFSERNIKHGTCVKTRKFNYKLNLAEEFVET